MKYGSMAVLMIAAVTAACRMEVEDPGEAPVVRVEPGRAPEIDVQPAEVEVGRDTQTIVVPDVDIGPPDPER